VWPGSPTKYHSGYGELRKKTEKSSGRGAKVVYKANTDLKSKESKNPDAGRKNAEDVSEDGPSPRSRKRVKRETGRKRSLEKKKKKGGSIK